MIFVKICLIKSQQQVLIGEENNNDIVDYQNINRKNFKIFYVK